MRSHLSNNRSSGQFRANITNTQTDEFINVHTENLLLEFGQAWFQNNPKHILQNDICSVNKFIFWLRSYL